MKSYLVIMGIFLGMNSGCSQSGGTDKNEGNYRQLSEQEAWVILHKGTERPFSGKYENFNEEGTYVCKQCGEALYKSEDKFDAHCGWPSFDDELDGAVKRVPDADGRRTEIVCNNCGGHLGHVFLGEGFTNKNTRHCVNSISLEFIPEDSEFVPLTETAYFAGGCFWGVEYYMEKAKGVKSAESGYMGGYKKNPSYNEVSSHATGHAEVVRVIYDPLETDYETLTKLFLEIHDPTQLNRQGPDVGDQYRSEIFYENSEQKAIAEKLLSELKGKGFDVKTKITASSAFWIAEDYHQDYYTNKQGTPYCHSYVKRF